MTYAQSARCFPVENAAREFKVDLPADGHAEIMQRLIKMLCEHIRKAFDKTRHDRRILDYLLFQIEREKASAPDAVNIEKIGDVIDAVDCYDGWPTCPVMNAIKSLECALTFLDQNCRWLAEATIDVMELHYDRRTRSLINEAAANLFRTAAYPRVKTTDATEIPAA